MLKLAPSIRSLTRRPRFFFVASTEQTRAVPVGASGAYAPMYDAAVSSSSTVNNTHVNHSAPEPNRTILVAAQARKRSRRPKRRPVKKKVQAMLPALAAHQRPPTATSTRISTFILGFMQLESSSVANSVNSAVRVAATKRMA
eukprot:3038291-Prymnesium_polylepis.1